MFLFWWILLLWCCCFRFCGGCFCMFCCCFCSCFCFIYCFFYVFLVDKTMIAQTLPSTTKQLGFHKVNCCHCSVFLVFSSSSTISMVTWKNNLLNIKGLGKLQLQQKNMKTPHKMATLTLQAWNRKPKYELREGKNVKTHFWSWKREDAETPPPPKKIKMNKQKTKENKN